MRETLKRAFDKAKTLAMVLVLATAIGGAVFHGATQLLLSPVVTNAVLAQGNFITSPIFTGKVSKQGQAPTLTNATFTAAQLNSSDFFGSFTVTTGGIATVLTFSSAWATAPFCIITVSSAPSTGPVWTVTTTAITFNALGMASSAVVNYMCIGTNQ